MKKELQEFLEQLRAYGKENAIPNVTDEVGQFLNMMVQVRKPKSVLEIGCANGYSTIWLAEAVNRIGGRVYTIDHSAPTYAEAQKNLKGSGLAEVVEFRFGDAVRVISGMEDGLEFDFVFVDGEKASYLDFWKAVEGRLAEGAVVIFDDMMAFPKKTSAFYDYIRMAEGVQQLLIPIDEKDGILMVLKS